MKICSKCKEEKNLEEFHNNRTRMDGKHHACKVCEIERNDARMKNEKHFSNKKNHYLLKTYGINYEQYLQMVKDKNNQCEICKKSQEFRALAIDHCHKTGIIRGLLCNKCNRALGYFEDNKDNLKNAILYLK